VFALHFALLSSLVSSASAAPLHHALAVRLDPATHVIRVDDAVTFGDEQPREGQSWEFVIHGGLGPKVVSKGWKLEPVPGPVSPSFFADGAVTEDSLLAVPLEHYRLVAKGTRREPIVLHYEGPIDHPIHAEGQEYQRAFSETPGLVTAEGAYLAGSTFWVPTFGSGLLTFDLAVTGLPAGWEVVSGGLRGEATDAGGVRTVTWSEGDPSEEIYLVGGPLHLTEERMGTVDLTAWLREDDAALAGKYITAAKSYLGMYDSILPAYPYASFALVENFWDTGYGMPGFTLLGPKVIRFPWILTSSFPHELLHNWWGNGVFVDPKGGNWCEGLTTYLADHLFAEQRGEGIEYRRDTLRAFTDFVKDNKDFPLSSFRARDSAASEAVGYGKSMMLFNMVRQRMGDAKFLAALGAFYQQHRFERASFADLGASFDAVAAGATPLAETGEGAMTWVKFIEIWTTRTGAPKLEITRAEVKPVEGPKPFVLEVDVKQVLAEGEQPFPLVIPISVTIEGQKEPSQREMPCSSVKCRGIIALSAQPLRVDVDPAFDVMRKLDPLELEPTLSTIFGSSKVHFVIPSGQSAAEQEAWKKLAQDWAKPATADVKLDSEIDKLPEGSTWVLGWNNRFGPPLAQLLEKRGVTGGSGEIKIGEKVVQAAGGSLVLVARSASDPTATVAWVGAGSVAAIPGLDRKLPHYSRYGYLAFEGDEPQNVLKGTWEPDASPLVRNVAPLIPPEIPKGKKKAPPDAMPTVPPLAPLVLPARKPLVLAPSPFDAARMADALSAAVRVLSSEEMTGRGLGTEGLSKATAWAEERLRQIGLVPAGDPISSRASIAASPEAARGFRQSWAWKGGRDNSEMKLTNLLGLVPGSDPALASSPVVLLAHIDHLGTGWPDVKEGNAGKIHPGADDNASGVAVLLEVARVLMEEPRRPRPVLVAVVTGEEAHLLGSKHLVAGFSASGSLPGAAGVVTPFACFNLDSVGRLKDGRLQVLDAQTAREWPFVFMGVKATTGVDVAVVQQAIEASDQAACTAVGVPGLHLLTGANAEAHTPLDTADRIDVAGMAKVALVTHEVVAWLAERKEALTVTIGGKPASPSSTPGGEAAPKTKDRASLGTIPDFTFSGPGVRATGVTAGSGAEKAGIRAGDVVVELAGKPVADLQGLSNVLGACNPGENVKVKVLRDGKEMTVEVVLGRR
jgi:aminopeptidase N